MKVVAVGAGAGMALAAGTGMAGAGADMAGAAMRVDRRNYPPLGHAAF